MKEKRKFLEIIVAIQPSSNPRWRNNKVHAFNPLHRLIDHAEIREMYGRGKLNIRVIK